MVLAQNWHVYTNELGKWIPSTWFNKLFFWAFVFPHRVHRNIALGPLSLLVTSRTMYFFNTLLSFPEQLARLEVRTRNIHFFWDCVWVLSRARDYLYSWTVCTETWKASFLFTVLAREERAWEEQAWEGWERWGLGCRGSRECSGRSTAVAAAAYGLCARGLTGRSWLSMSWHSRDSCIGTSWGSGFPQCGWAGCSSGRPSFHRGCTGRPHWGPFRCS